MYNLKYFNYNYTEFVGYDKREKLIWTSGEVSRITNKISEKGSPKTHIKNISPSKTLGLGFSYHKYTCDIFSEDLVSPTIKEGS